MKILIVCGEYFNQSNGLSISTQRFVKEFVRLGEEVRVLSSDHGGVSDYSVPVMHIPLVDGINDQLSDTGHGKHGFHDHGTAQRRGHLGAHDRDDRYQRVAQGVLEKDLPFTHALGTRRVQIILPGYVQHGGPDRTCQRRCVEETQRDGWKDVAFQAIHPNPYCSWSLP